MARHVRKDDMVMVVSGAAAKEKRPRKVLRVIPARNKIVVEGVNIRKKHVKPTQKNPQGGIIEKEMPIHISNVQPVHNGKPTRVRFDMQASGSKVRVAVKSGAVIGPELKKARK